MMIYYVSVYICVESGDYCGNKNILFISYFTRAVWLPIGLFIKDSHIVV